MEKRPRNNLLIIQYIAIRILWINGIVKIEKFGDNECASLSLTILNLKYYRHFLYVFGLNHQNFFLQLQSKESVKLLTQHQYISIRSVSIVQSEELITEFYNDPITHKIYQLKPKQTQILTFKKHPDNPNFVYPSLSGYEGTLFSNSSKFIPKLQIFKFGPYNADHLPLGNCILHPPEYDIMRQMKVLNSVYQSNNTDNEDSTISIDSTVSTVSTVSTESTVSTVTNSSVEMIDLSSDSIVSVPIIPDLIQPDADANLPVIANDIQSDTNPSVQILPDPIQIETSLSYTMVSSPFLLKQTVTLPVFGKIMSYQLSKSLVPLSLDIPTFSCNAQCHKAVPAMMISENLFPAQCPRLYPQLKENHVLPLEPKPVTVRKKRKRIW